jgi:hypothetical protein
MWGGQRTRRDGMGSEPQPPYDATVSRSAAVQCIVSLSAAQMAHISRAPTPSAWHADGQQRRNRSQPHVDGVGYAVLCYVYRPISPLIDLKLHVLVLKSMAFRYRISVPGWDYERRIPGWV